MHGRGVCMAGGAWQGACMARGCAWWGAYMPVGMHGRGLAGWGGMHGRGVCVAGGMCGRGHSWQGGGHVWQGACMAGGHVWQGAMHGRGRVHGRYYEIRSISGRYPSYWNAFLLLEVFVNKIAWQIVRVDDWTAERAIIASNDFLERIIQNSVDEFLHLIK